MNCKQLEKLQAERDALLVLNQRLEAEVDALRGEAKAEYLRQWPAVEIAYSEEIERWVLYFGNGARAQHRYYEDAEAVKRAYDEMVRLAAEPDPDLCGELIGSKDARRILSGR